jgi:putative Mg2+ transporter-C (MgtC) family protein
VTAIWWCGPARATPAWPAKNAGLRTHTLVGLGAALFMLISKYGSTTSCGPG